MRDFINNAAWFGVVLTLAIYMGGLLLRRRYKLAILNPLLLAGVVIIAIYSLTGLDIAAYQRQTRLFSDLLTPATVCLAIPLYEKLALLKKHWRAVLIALLAGMLTSFLCIWAIAALFDLDHAMYVTLLPKSITTAIGMDVSRELGGSVPLTVAVIVITGVVGSVIAQGVFRLFRIHHPVAKGLALGASAHAIGTSRAMELGEVEGAMSSLAIAVTGLMTVGFVQLVAPLV